jgi:hypothetical protein
MHWGNKGAMNLLQLLPWLALGRWMIVGLVFLGVGIALLYIAVGWLHLPPIFGTALSAEIGMLIGFLLMIAGFWLSLPEVDKALAISRCRYCDQFPMDLAKTCKSIQNIPRV